MQKKNESNLVLVDPGVVGAAPVDDAIREPECNLLLGALNGVAAVDDVPADLNAVVAADGARVRGGRVSGADDLAAGSDDALALPHHGDDGAGDDVLDEGATCTNFMALRKKPFFSKRLMMSPMRPRCTPSGLIMMKETSALAMVKDAERQGEESELRRSAGQRRWRRVSVDGSSIGFYISHSGIP
jgi:hypothetical protein